MSGPKPFAVVYGATSFTARQLLTYLHAHPALAAEEFDFAISGRNKDKLDTLNEQLLEGKREVIVLELSDLEGVEAMVKRANVIINCAGPYRNTNAENIISQVVPITQHHPQRFTNTNTPHLHSACAKTGTHYVDLCGEAAWLSTHIIPKYHAIAGETGACIVPASGFDSVPSDMTVYLAQKTLRASYPGGILADSISMFKCSATIAGGTVQSFVSLTELPKSERRSPEFTLCPGSDLPTTKPLLSPSLPATSASNAQTGTYFFMYVFNRCIVRRSQFLSSTLYPSASTYGSTDPQPSDEGEGKEEEVMKYMEGLDIGYGKVKSSLSTILMGFGFGLFFGVKWVRNLILSYLPKAGEGASLEKLHAGYFKLTNISTSRPTSTDGKVVQVLTKFNGQGDPGYLSTPYMIAESALSLILPPPANTSLPPLAKKGGVLTPATAFGDVLLKRLEDSGNFEISSQIVEA
ncbi:hypothetical protein L202_04692 [Cryptococcus amylolentus CBS 6039]|uniref:Saccharopine dehydrogenase NADP binding domain-containing protein n=1 Tax=Cryptococcus amylolentus CBS 6039 TaxID=1295533 RepID=A0A1E3HMF0_9TREE|nr:hypothetical protein L202_04692 [Cryptococcus amylolentus CBS 6039]ODN77520.1 hypothetical protein L202_04692 [Cryptococcus amylolentus CBS 6039]